MDEFRNANQTRIPGTLVLYFKYLSGDVTCLHTSGQL